MVVRNGRLSSAKDANRPLSSDSSDSFLFPSSKFDASICSTNEETFSESASYTPGRDTSFPYWNPSPSTEFTFTSEAEQHVLRSKEELHCCHVKAPSMNQLQLSSQVLLSSTAKNQHEQLKTVHLRCKSSGPNVMHARGNSTGVTAEAPSTRGKVMSKLFTDNAEPTCGGSQGRNGPCGSLDGIGSSPLQHTSAVHELTRSHKIPSTSLNDVELLKSQGYKTALKELEAVRLQMREEIRKRDEVCAALKEALKMDKENAVKAVTEEIKRREEAVTALSNAKVEADSLKQEAATARQQAAADRSKYIETLANLNNIKKKLAVETQLRKDAEERAWQAKQDLARLLRKSRREYTDYSFAKLQEATNNFCDDQKLGEGGYGGVYKGMIDHMSVAVKVLKQTGLNGQQQFQHEVEVLSHIHHPHIVVLLGACQERACIVYEYMENGSLEDRLMCKGGTPPLPWYVRFRICFEVATALIFLHNVAPHPIVHRDLKPGNILLDHNFVSKLSDAGLARWIPNSSVYSLSVCRETKPAGTFAYMDPEYLRTGSFGPHSDLFALGVVILQVLTGKLQVGVVDLVEEAVDNERLCEVIDQSAGEWPLSEAVELAKLGLQCAEPRRRDRPNLVTEVFVVLERLREVAQTAAMAKVNSRSFYNDVIPSFFICHLSQELMVNPHIAADGFTYECVAIKNWLTHHDISPMTNLKLAHKNLLKNYSLQSAIQSWKEKMNHL